MRQLLCISLLFMLSLGYSQDYVGIPQNNASWKIGWFASPCADNLCGFYEYIALGDTLIGANSYTKIYLYERGWFDPLAYGGYHACIRNDTGTKKVYAIRSNTSVEQLLYDFNLKQGDTTEVNGDTAVVMSVDSVEINSNLRYIYNLSSLLSESEDNFYLDYAIIEGVGSSNGLFHGPGYSNVNFLSYDLICHSVNQNGVYPVGASDCSSILDLITQQEKDVMFYPNPTANTIYVNSKYLDSQFQIVDINGSILFYGSLQSEIDISFLTQGFYLFRLYNKGGKVIEQEKILKF